nr:signal peptidase I [uncultured Sellimonas sp.]
MKQEGLEETEKKKSTAREVLDWVIYIGIVLLLSWLIVTFVGVRTVVDGQSMEPTLQDGNNLIVDKLSYRFRDPKRYEIIVFPYKYEENTYYIKRIIGLPGETVQVMDGEVYIDGAPLGEDYGAEPMEDPGIAAEPIQLGEDEYFVLGDNRNHSSDSRDPSVGVLKRDDLVGRAWIRIYPFDEMGFVVHE